jgi:DNA-directed RNA polymerase specialized sigma24 family protein
VLVELIGLSTEEAGRALGVQASTIRSLTRNAREAFRHTEVPDA